MGLTWVLAGWLLPALLLLPEAAHGGSVATAAAGAPPIKSLAAIPGVVGGALEAGLWRLRHGCPARGPHAAEAEVGAQLAAGGTEPLVRPLYWWLLVTCTWMVCCAMND